jgi:Putative auto-transporter adhesin, head GIN domain
MRGLFVMALLCCATISPACAQRMPLNGSGKIIKKEWPLTGFDKVELINLAGKVEIEVGRPFSITVAVDDNLEALLQGVVRGQTLQLVLEGNRSNRLYIEKTNIVVRISMPGLSFVQQHGNNSLQVSGLKESYLKIKSQENGNTRLMGEVDELEIISSGNGNVYAGDIYCNRVKVHKSGNGNVFINSDSSFIAIGSGNGNVVNKGKGRADGNSGISGNGDIIYTADADRPVVVPATGKAKRLPVTITNFTASRVSLSVKYPVQGSYGIGLKPGETIVESFPVGTQLFYGKQITFYKTPAYRVTAEEKDQSFEIR